MCSKQAITSKPTEDTLAIQFNDVSKAYKLYRSDKHRFLSIFSKKVPHKTVYANKHVSFTINKGEAVAFFGKNGAGKSTILKMITGVCFPTEGEVVINGRVSALLELTAGFDKEFTGRENIRLRGQIWGLSDHEIDVIEPDIIEFAELGDYIDQPLRTYSSGMKARLGFAFASSLRPEILVVDEALSVGDAAFRKKCSERVSEIIRRDNVTVIFVTHSTSSAKDFCNRGIVLKKGELQFDGPIDEAIDFYEGKPAKPASKPVAEKKDNAAN